AGRDPGLRPRHGGAGGGGVRAEPGPGDGHPGPDGRGAEPLGDQPRPPVHPAERMSPDARFRQAAWTYLGYGVLYWLGGLALMQAGIGPRGMTPGGAAWFLVGALLVVVFPWLLMRARPWFERWVLSRRDFARILTLLVAPRAV